MLSKILVGCSILWFLGMTSVRPISTDAQRNQPIRALDIRFCDGFDFPVGDVDGKGNYTDPSGKVHEGWYIATHTAEEYTLGIHTGEDWNGSGGGNTDFGQPVYASAEGEVLTSDDFGKPWGNVILIRHLVLENAKIDTVYSVYGHLEKRLVNKGEWVTRRQLIGRIGTGDGAYPAHLHWEMRKSNMRDFAADYWPSNHNKTIEWVKQHYWNPSEYVGNHRNCLKPQSEKQLLLVVKSNYSMYLLEYGVVSAQYKIALGQEPSGHKQKQGDNRTPEGQYRIIEKSIGPFGGAYGAFLGSRWMRLNYPNNWDAEAGFRKGIITKSQLSQIKQANAQQKEPLKTTELGGGIGIHGWNGAWPGRDKQNLTWGCISLEKEELEALYEKVKPGTKVLILP